MSIGGLVAAVGCAVLPALTGAPTAAGAPAGQSLLGQVRSGSLPLGGSLVRLWAVPASEGPVPPRQLGSDTATPGGTFRIPLVGAEPAGTTYYVTADRGPGLELAAVLGRSPGNVVVLNEATTVAAGFALAQFIDHGTVSGSAPGPANAAAMAANLADSRSGTPGAVLRTPPNGWLTSTLREFDTLANLLVPCARNASQCDPLISAATPPGGAPPSNSFDAIASIARNPANHAADLFALARQAPQVYRPTLAGAEAPDAWTLAIRFDGDGSTMNGPGNFAIDARGNVWVTDNYTFSRDPLAPVCGGKLLLEFTPDGRYAPGSPFTGGGLDGAGFGITLDPAGHVWVGNFGFASDDCSAPPAHNSVSELTADGRPLSPSATSSAGGFTQGHISWPQGVVSDSSGTISVANCGTDTVTTYPGGDPAKATNAPAMVEKPFDIALNATGQRFVTGNLSSSVAVLDPDGSPARPVISGNGIDHPLGIAADTRGTMWVANAGSISVPCPDGGYTGQPGAASITYLGDGSAEPVTFTGGGLTVPWGIAVDGDDHVWVANFDGRRLSEFCGVTVSACPPGARTGSAISPAGGYGFDGLVRNTGVAIDPSGNVWVANNWKNIPLPHANPGGYQVVAFIGAATPLRTPLIGPPQRLPGVR